MFGSIDGKYSAGTFSQADSALAEKAAKKLGLSVLEVNDQTTRDLAVKLPAGHVHANASGIAPNTRKAVYALLMNISGAGAQSDKEMVELPWGLQREAGGRAFTVIRTEGRIFPDRRCLVPASEFRHRSRGKDYAFSLADGDWFYFAGIWRPETREWPEAYAILTTEANADVAPFHDRQMAAARSEQRMAWLDRTRREDELLRPLSAGTFRVTRTSAEARQSELAF